MAQHPTNTPIPPLSSISTAIFTPIEEDQLLLPFTPPTSRIERLHAKLHALETNRRRVRTNIVTLYRRECARLIQAARMEEKAAAEAGTPLQDDTPPPEATEEELDAMIANMTAEPAAGEREEQAPRVPNFQFVPRTRKEHWATQLQITISKGLTDLKGYEDHVATIRNGYKELLEREEKASREIG